ncbi:hypothetical protein HXX76_009231 [Chlamydomonas incerta]|uniref:Uncharacterized protein n=1 Tax=Chlamydomonas incerta TaxID=51695 RepID=A0A835T4S6_CHLIN|nr:hypothetical protein HXX76_009231 [Chlamydomonas incerta]|eukprot:KAG2431735.1 hypothetical protein HXX76_009231 [Chlamydomonas incerta]
MDSSKLIVAAFSPRAVSSGHGPSAALAHCGCSLTSKVLVSAAWAGRTAACERLLAEGCEVGVEAACAAAEAGHLRLCSLLWSKRCRDYTIGSEVEAHWRHSCGGPIYYRIKLEHWDVVRVAEAACFGGHAAVLQWLARDAGLYDEAARRDDEYSQQQIDAGLAAAAARGGHVSLLQRLLAKLAAPRDAYDSTWRRPLLSYVALGCALPVFRDLAAKWQQLEPPQPDAPMAARGDGFAILLHALGSGTPDWKEKVELVLARRPDILAAAMAEMDQPPPCMPCDPFKWAAAQPDFQQRLRFLVSDKGAKALPAAAVAAAGAGDGPALAQHLLVAALQAGNLAAAPHLHARGLAPVLPTAEQAAAAGGAAAETAAFGGAAGDAAGGLADAEWDKPMNEVGLDGRLRGRFSENQWDRRVHG